MLIQVGGFGVMTLASSLVTFALPNEPAAIVTFPGASTVLASVSGIGGKIANVTT